MGYKYLKVQIEDGIGTVTIDRPPVNALNEAVLKELIEAFTEFASKKEILVVILTGGGEHAFVAGADIKELVDIDARGGMAFSRKGHKTTGIIEGFERPVICAINGLALGGGCELAMACDIRIMSEKAIIGQPEANLGVIPGAGGTQRLPRLISKGKAKELLFTCDAISAEEALRIGLVEKVVPPNQVLKEARDMAVKIAKKGPVAIKFIKKAVNEGMDLPFKKAAELEIKLFGQLCDTEDKKEGLSAFIDKKPPQFHDK